MISLIKSKLRYPRRCDYDMFYIEHPLIIPYTNKRYVSLQERLVQQAIINSYDNLPQLIALSHSHQLHRIQNMFIRNALKTYIQNRIAELTEKQKEKK